jgi:hypothetical protein
MVENTLIITILGSFFERGEAMVTERRFAMRRLMTVPIDCEYGGNGTGRCMPIKGITVNVSDSGICFYTHENLSAGLGLKLASSVIWDTPKEGKVQWCRQIMGGLYKIGLALA